MWVLRFGNGVTSAGVAVTDALAADLRLADGEPAWKRLLARYPSIAAQFADARPIREFTWMPCVAFRASEAAGERWAMLPSAAAFVDPLFSSGIPLTLVGIERLARLMEEGKFARPAGVGALEEYSRVTLAEADHTARFVAGCYASFPCFQDFAAYAMFYFAAASFSEMTRRLGGVSRGFLCEADPEFAAAVAQLSPALGRRSDLASLVGAAAGRLNIAGLCDPEKRNWYAVDLEDTIRGASKLGATTEEVRAMLAQFG
jgi:FADH2 O2-dependent halogenase